MAQVAELARWAHRGARFVRPGSWRSSARGDPRRIELVGEPGIGKTRLLAELGGAGGRTRVPRALGVGVASSSRTSRSGSSSTRSTSTSAGSTRIASKSLDGDVRTELVDRLPVRSPASRRAQGRDPARALPQPPRRPRAAGDCSRRAQTARARARRLPLGRPCVGRAARRPASPTAGRAGARLRVAVRPRQLSERLGAALERAHRTGALAAHRARGR